MALFKILYSINKILYFINIYNGCNIFLHLKYYLQFIFYFLFLLLLFFLSFAIKFELIYSTGFFFLCFFFLSTICALWCISIAIEITKQHIPIFIYLYMYFHKKIITRVQFSFYSSARGAQHF